MGRRRRSHLRRMGITHLQYHTTGVEQSHPPMLASHSILLIVTIPILRPIKLLKTMSRPLTSLLAVRRLMQRLEETMWDIMVSSLATAYEIATLAWMLVR